VKLERNGQPLNVADVLELTVAEAAAVCAGPRRDPRAAAHRRCGPGIREAGPAVPTLSGGEAQRLKLAGFLAEAAQQRKQSLAKKGTLFLFDEPTTGLHFDDIAKLMRALRKLLEAGHSLIVIEHNLDVIRAGDWLIDLGPEGGDGGGLIVAEARPRRRHVKVAHGPGPARIRPGHGRGRRAVREVAPMLYKPQRKAGRKAPQAKNAIEIVNARSTTSSP
jgi:excinuclease ABC subunit A